MVAHVGSLLGLAAEQGPPCEIERAAYARAWPMWVASTEGEGRPARMCCTRQSLSMPKRAKGTYVLVRPQAKGRCAYVLPCRDRDGPLVQEHFANFAARQPEPVPEWQGGAPQVYLGRPDGQPHGADVLRVAPGAGLSAPPLTRSAWAAASGYLESVERAFLANTDGPCGDIPKDALTADTCPQSSSLSFEILALTCTVANYAETRGAACNLYASSDDDARGPRLTAQRLADPSSHAVSDPVAERYGDDLAGGDVRDTVEESCDVCVATRITRELCALPNSIEKSVARVLVDEGHPVEGAGVFFTASLATVQRGRLRHVPFTKARTVLRLRGRAQTQLAPLGSTFSSGWAEMLARPVLSPVEAALYAPQIRELAESVNLSAAAPEVRDIGGLGAKEGPPLLDVCAAGAPRRVTGAWALLAERHQDVCEELTHLVDPDEAFDDGDSEEVRKQLVALVLPWVDASRGPPESVNLDDAIAQARTHSPELCFPKGSADYLRRHLRPGPAQDP